MANLVKQQVPQSAPAAQSSVAAPPQSQASRQPDQSAARSAGARLAGGTSSSTMLTGPGGVQPNLLNIGKNTLLGG